MRLKGYLTELASEYGKGITFIDIDETIFRTFAMIYVLDKGTKEVVKKLNNQEFNTYKLKDNEEFQFNEFRDADLFNKTSIPIPQTIKRIKQQFKQDVSKGKNRKTRIERRSGGCDCSGFGDISENHEMVPYF